MFLLPRPPGWSWLGSQGADSHTGESQGLEPLSIDGFLFLNYALISSPSGTNAYVLMSSLP